MAAERSSRSDRSSRPVWLGEVDDERTWDHVRIHVQLLRDKRLGNTRSTPKRSVVLAVYVGLAFHADIETGGARPSADTLGTYAGCDEQTARAALKVLAQAGYLKLTPRPGKAPICKLLQPPELPAEHDYAADTAGATPDLDVVDEPTTPGVTPDVDVHSPGAAPDHPGSHTRTGPGVRPDEQDPLNKNHFTSSCAPRVETEAEAEDVDVDRLGRQLVAELAGALPHPSLVEGLFRPSDAGGRIALGRELARRVLAGWPAEQLVVEVAGGLGHAGPPRSVVGVLLDRIRKLEERPFVVDSERNRTADLAASARRHGQVLAATGLDEGELLVELWSCYGPPPGEPLGPGWLAAVDGAGLITAGLLDADGHITAACIRALPQDVIERLRAAAA